MTEIIKAVISCTECPASVAVKVHPGVFTTYVAQRDHEQGSNRSAGSRAALSVPAAAVVGEPVGYVSAPELMQLKTGVSCVDLFREPQPGGIDFAPVYAAPSAPDEGQPISAGVFEAMGEALRPFATTDWADENGWTDIACQNDRVVDWFGPSQFFAAGTAYLAYCNLSASRISQQDAELERYRAALRAIIERSHNDPLGTSKVVDMRRIAEQAIGEKP